MITFGIGTLILIFLGIFLCPAFTLGCVLISLGYSGLGITAIVVSIIVGMAKLYQK